MGAGVIWETSRYLKSADTYQVGTYGTWVTWDPSGAMAEGQTTLGDYLESLTWP